MLDKITQMLKAATVIQHLNILTSHLRSLLLHIQNAGFPEKHESDVQAEMTRVLRGRRYSFRTRSVVTDLRGTVLFESRPEAIHSLGAKLPRLLLRAPPRLLGIVILFRGTSVRSASSARRVVCFRAGRAARARACVRAGS